MEAVLQVWADRGHIAGTHGKSSQRLSFNKGEEWYLIRKGAGAELKISDSLIRIQNIFQEAFTELDASNFDFVFLLTVKANAFQDVSMSRQ